jgi:hypothetical protein
VSYLLSVFVIVFKKFVNVVCNFKLIILYSSIIKFVCIFLAVVIVTADLFVCVLTVNL